MNTKQLQYAVLLAETGSFSQLAEKLHITQPALSKHILSLEKELGVSLFDRSRTPVQPTAAGAHLVREAKKLLYSQDQLLRSMAQFRTGERGRLTIGATPFRSAYLLPPILQQLRKEFPGLQIRVVEENSAALHRDAVDGRFDVAVLNLPVDEAALECFPMEPDTLALVIPKVLAAAPVATFADCAGLPFVVVSDGQEMRGLFEKLCTVTGTQPEIAAEVVGLTTAWDMACAGVGATILPMQFLHSRPLETMTVLPITGDLRLRQTAATVKRGQYLSPYAETALNLLTAKPH